MYGTPIYYTEYVSILLMIRVLSTNYDFLETSLCSEKFPYKSKTTSGTGFFNILPIFELTLTASMSTGQYRSNESEVES